MRRPASHRAFTLIELMMVCVVLGLLASLVILNLESILPEERIKAASRDIGGLLELARSEAAVKGVSYGIVYDLDNHEFWLLQPVRATDDQYEDLDEEDKKKNRIEMSRTTLPKDVEFKDIQMGAGSDATRTTGEVHIEMTPLGISSGHIVHLINTDTKQEMSIELNPLTALVTYHPGYYEFEELEEYND